MKEDLTATHTQLGWIGLKCLSTYTFSIEKSTLLSSFKPPRAVAAAASQKCPL